MESASGKFLQCLFVWILILFHFLKYQLGKHWEFDSYFTSALWGVCPTLCGLGPGLFRGGLLAGCPSFKSLAFISAPFNILFGVLWFHHGVSRYGSTFIYPAWYSNVFSNLDIFLLFEYCLFLIISNLLFWNFNQTHFQSSPHESSMSLLFSIPFCFSLFYLFCVIYLHIFSISPIFWSLVSNIWSNKS